MDGKHSQRVLMLLRAEVTDRTVETILEGNNKGQILCYK
jgi:hypothetical protein